MYSSTTLDVTDNNAYFWVKHLSTGEITVGRYQHELLWNSSVRAGLFEIVGNGFPQKSIDYEIITEIIHPFYNQQ